MKPLKASEPSSEVTCSACGCTGFPDVAQPAKAGRRIYPPPCKQCLGKGRVNPS
jgi:DnaJ-class molecular chaperone